MPEQRQCFVCGRVGTRGFERERTTGVPGWRCRGAIACQRRRDAWVRGFTRYRSKATA